MIRYIAVTESADHNESQASYIPENQIERIDRDTSGKAVLIVREYRETAREGNDGYGTREWRIDGYESQERYSVMKFEDLIDWLNGVQRPIVNLDNMTPEEREAFQNNLVAARRALRTIDKGTTLQPASQTGIDSDVYAVVTMLKNGEYGEHWAGTELGGRLETEITKLVGSENEKANRLRRAEELLAEVWHEWNNDDATRKALGDDMGNVIGSFIYPDRTNC